MKAVIRTGSVEGFFKRGRDIARLADQCNPIPEERVIAYEDPEELARIKLAKTCPLLTERFARRCIGVCACDIRL